jgi:hypothetical protein
MEAYMDTAICSWCNKEKEIGEFKTKRNGQRTKMCNRCLDVFKKFRDTHRGEKCQWCGAPSEGFTFCATHRELIKQRKRIKDAQLPPRTCPRCKTNPIPLGKQMCQACKQVILDGRVSRDRARTRVMVTEIYKQYGGAFCACCGEDIWEFLTLDHINDDGAAHRKEIGGSGYKLQLWAKRNGYPAGLRVMCRNCNFGRYVNGGICPHQQQKVAA